MKLYWLKRLALKWLVNDQDFYFIMAALRGPDIATEDHIAGMGTTNIRIKEKSTARIRYKVGLRQGAIIESGSPMIIAEMEGITLNSEDERSWCHFDGHILTAIACLQKVGYKWQL